ncbi:uncharacterized protein RHO25_008363 [Cercospora beticola]|uniref:Uncharacterized protein n=1 Tax=Cercospora beticola TaxID=122368 RepID=A0ABZ0NVX1_CERBT|nr:hypothetical protein RHO25_008363 [Cercospora beticola]CAK1357520.1 unnamed protein product [Cercospora beticola]
MAHQDDARGIHVPLHEEEEERSRSPSLAEDASGHSSENYDQFEEYLPEMFFPEEIDADDIIRNSTVESYYSDDETDDGSSLTLFHAGYNSYNPYSSNWEQQMEEAVPIPPRVPISRRPVPSRAFPSRAPTMEKLDSVPEDPNLVTWDKDDPANPQ